MTTTRPTDLYVLQLIAALRLRNVSGERIGQLVAEVESHVTESGESARQAFGDPRGYADACTRGDRPASLWRGLAGPASAVAAVAGFMLAAGFEVGLSGSRMWGLNGWWIAVIGASLLLVSFWFIPVNAIVDPRTGGRRFGRASLLLFVAGSAAAMLAVMAVLHLLAN